MRGSGNGGVYAPTGEWLLLVGSLYRFTTSIPLLLWNHAAAISVSSRLSQNVFATPESHLVTSTHPLEAGGNFGDATIHDSRFLRSHFAARMKAGSLSGYFTGVGVKSLTGTEIDPAVSRGHELQGVDSFREFLGTPSDKVTIPVKWVWLSDEEAPLVLPLTGTWYDSRRGKSHRGPEYRLYYPASAEEVVYRARPADTLFLCMPQEGDLLALLCPHGSSIEQQLLWLFDLDLEGKELFQRDLRIDHGRSLDMAARHVLELIDIEVAVTDDNWLERLLKVFPSGLPQTRKFPLFARKAVENVDPLAAPDEALLAWMETEERLFMTYERHIVGQRLKEGFFHDGAADVDGFVRYRTPGSSTSAPSVRTP